MAAVCRQLLVLWSLVAAGKLTAVEAQSVAWTPIIQTTLCRNEHMPDIKTNTARLTINNDGHTPLTLLLYTQSSECYQCDLDLVTMISDNCSVLVDTRWKVKVEIRTLNGSQNITFPSCCAANNTHKFEEGGEYFIYIRENKDNNAIHCQFVLYNTPTDANIPIYVACAIGVCLAVLWVVARSLYRRGMVHRLLCIWTTEYVMSDLGTPIIVNPTDETTVSSGSTDPGSTPHRKERLKSLDTFRGLSIVVMIFVNYKGGYYWFFQHSKWNGLTVADLVFPWFVFIMGTSMIFSFQGQLRRGSSKLSMFGKIVRRSIILFVLGLVINSFGGNDNGVKASQFRILGVLQRFALTYFIVASVHLIFAKHLDDSQPSGQVLLRDVTNFWPEWIVHLSLVAVHTAITFGLSVPGCPRGYLGPGGKAEHNRHSNCTGGAAGYIDRQVFGDAHLDQHPTCLEIYDTVIPHEPEGLLGTLTSAFLCFLGLQAGKILFVHKDRMQRCIRFVLWGIVLGLMAGIMCEFSKNEGWIPVNKNLWSLSFVVALASLAFLLLAIFYMLIDVWGLWSGAPFQFPGMNPIVLYMGHEMLNGRFPVGFEVADSHAAHLAMGLWGAVFWVLVGYYLHYKSIFITV